MGTTYIVNEFNEVVPYDNGRASNSTRDRRELTEFEEQLLAEIEELKKEPANRLEAEVDVKIADLFNALNTELEGKKSKQQQAKDKLYYNGQQLILLEFYQKVLQI